MSRTEHVEYLIIVPNYWGVGDTIDEAVEQLLAAGGYIGGGFILYRFKPETIFQGVSPFDGTFQYSHIDDRSAPEPPSKTEVTAVDAIRFRQSMITRALIFDD